MGIVGRVESSLKMGKKGGPTYTGVSEIEGEMAGLV